MTDTNRHETKLRNILDRAHYSTSAPEDYAPKNERAEAEVRHLAAVSKALENVPELVAESRDPLAQQFIDLAEAAAKSLEEMGNASMADGQRRHDEYYRLATVTRQKGAYQAKEALAYLGGIAKIRDVSEEAEKPVVMLPRETTVTDCRVENPSPGYQMAPAEEHPLRTYQKAIGQIED